MFGDSSSIVPAGGHRFDGREMFTESEWRAIAHSLHLSRRESQIIEWIFRGKNEASIAPLLGISRHTIHTHLKHVYDRLRVHDRSELMLRVFAEHLALLPRRERSSDSPAS